jgi:hypothetical protein
MKMYNNSDSAFETNIHSKMNRIGIKNWISRKVFLKSVCLSLLAASIIFGSCSKNNEEVTPQLSKIDITNSTALFIASSKSNLKTAEQVGNKLFKVTNEGVVQEVTFWDKSGKQMTDTFVPEMIYFIANSDFFIARINTTNYLVRKSDGGIFVLNTTLGKPYEYDRRTGGYVNSDFIVQDANKNLYFTSENRIYKINVSNPNSLTISPVTPDTEDAWNFTVSSKGDVFYETKDAYRVCKSNGGLYNIPTNASTLNSWTGLDGRIKYATNDKALFAVDIDAKGNASIDKKVFDFQIGGLGNQVNMLRFKSRVILLNEENPISHGQPPILEIDNQANYPRQISLSYNICEIKKVVNSENYYYLSGLNSSQQPVLIKVNPTNDAVTELLKAGAYDIYAMTVNKKDELIFNALRMSDGVKVIGKISSEGTLQIIDTKLNSGVVALERIQ